MANEVVFDPRLTKSDRLVLANLAGGLFQDKHAGNGHATNGLDANRQASESSGTSTLTWEAAGQSARCCPGFIHSLNQMRLRKQ